MRPICVLIFIICIRLVYSQDITNALRHHVNSGPDLDEEPNIIRFGDGPYIVLVIVTGTNFKCTGAVITKYFVLTAAHCFIGTEQKKSAVILYGETSYKSEDLLSNNIHNLNYINSTDVIIHPDYLADKPSARYRNPDLALIELYRSILDDFTSPVKILTLAGSWPLDTSLDLYELGCVILAYGIDDNNDTLIYRAEVHAHHTTEGCKCVHSNTICSKQPPTVFCHGQTAYPLICHRQIYGIGSYNIIGTKCTPPKDMESMVHNLRCEEAAGTVMTYVCPFLNWINDIVEDPVITPAPAYYNKFSTKLLSVSFPVTSGYLDLNT
ncbi:hypothetical protein O3M35_006127 [Rhynocoris fuscipes]|uniref:Peptidase S1 domain-containing protein n=1 Tax=Rhynocoris fuscipes TaxID=488301 RepID=A0AAW1DFU9_9HEMI